MMTISDLYAGKPDANDEIREIGYDDFIESYISPSSIDIDAIASTKYGSPFFVKGDKGTGKTALLHFLSQHILKLDNSSCSSFISFERDFSDVKRQKLEHISRAISTSILIDQNIATSNSDADHDFSYIWRWQFYQKVLDDNERFNGGLFVLDNNYIDFQKQLSKINKTVDNNRMKLPAKFSLSATHNHTLNTTTASANAELVDLTKADFQKSIEYSKFVKIIESADEVVRTLKRTDVPYYIFIDELEAYRANDATFFRNLRMIRDLLFTTKILNDIFQDGTKVICSIRPEIIESISRFIITKQLHKLMQGFDVRLSWEHTNTNSFHHPVIKILTKRIELAEKRQKSFTSHENLISRWFSSRVYETHVCVFILDNSWHKPRDIIRLILASQSTNAKTFTKFNQSAFDTLMQEYSRLSLEEIKEEMAALYSPEDLANIIRCMRGYKKYFSSEEFQARARNLCPNCAIAVETTKVLEDMYRIGLVGNILNPKTPQRWNHKGEHGLIIDENWKIVVHPSLLRILNLSGSRDKHIDVLSERVIHQRKFFSVKCSRCNIDFQVPFQPRENGRPLLCKNCFYAVACANCNSPVRVPFEPAEGRRVYCRHCRPTK